MPSETNTSVIDSIRKNTCSVLPGEYISEIQRDTNNSFDEDTSRRHPCFVPASVSPGNKPRERNHPMPPKIRSVSVHAKISSAQIQRRASALNKNNADALPKSFYQKNRILIGTNVLTLFLLGLACLGSAVFAKKITVTLILIVCGGIFIGQSLSVFCFTKKMEAAINKLSAASLVRVDTKKNKKLLTWNRADVTSRCNLEPSRCNDDTQ